MNTTNPDDRSNSPDADDVTKPMNRREKSRAFADAYQAEPPTSTPILMHRPRAVPASVVKTVLAYDKALGVSISLAQHNAAPKARDDADAATDAAERQMVETMGRAGIHVAVVGDLVAVASFDGRECPETGAQHGGILFGREGVAGA